MPSASPDVLRAIDNEINAQQQKDLGDIQEVKKLYGEGSSRKPIVGYVFLAVQLSFAASRALEKTQRHKELEHRGTKEQLDDLKRQQNGLRSFGVSLLGLLKSNVSVLG